MWWSILAGTCILNAMMLMVHYLGPKGILLSWIPGRTLMLVFSLLHKNEFIDTLRYSWASGLVPVVFLAALHGGIRLMERRGRLPRFHCATKQWSLYWSLALSAMAGIICLIGFVHQPVLYLGLGIFAILLNIVNVTDAPQHLSGNLHLSLEYIIGVNIIVIGLLVAVNELIDMGELVWAGILSNVPLFAFILMLGATVQATPEALKTMGQHIYMLSYQIWPNMAFVGVLWGTAPFVSNEVGCVIATAGMLVILTVQYSMIKSII